MSVYASSFYAFNLRLATLAYDTIKQTALIHVYPINMSLY